MNALKHLLDYDKNLLTCHVSFSAASSWSNRWLFLKSVSWNVTVIGKTPLRMWISLVSLVKGLVYFALGPLFCPCNISVWPTYYCRCHEVTHHWSESISPDYSPIINVSQSRTIVILRGLPWCFWGFVLHSLIGDCSNASPDKKDTWSASD